jgi:hypothetical protein
MTRTVSSALAAALEETVTGIGYLVQIALGGSPTSYLRWCDIGDHYYPQTGSPPSGGNLYSAVDFTVSGIALALDSPSPKSVTIDVQNLDSAMSAIVLNADLSTAEVTIWQIARGITSTGDAAQLGVFVVDGAEIGLDSVRLALSAYAAANLFAPRLRVNAANGLSRALPPGTKITWANQIYEIGENTNG